MTRHATAPAASVDQFAEELFSALPRADQRRWARIYLRGLLATPGKKSLRRIASAVAASPTASQAMHQFINVSPWDWEPVRDELARWITGRLAPEAYVIDAAYIPKRGDRSCGVHTRFVPQLGRHASCQVGLGVFLASGREVLPTHWRLHLPTHWLTETERRRTRIQGRDHARTMEQEATDLAMSRGHRVGGRPLPVVADLTSHTDPLHLVRALSRRGQPFVVRVPPHARVTTADGVRREVRSVTDCPGRSVTFTAGGADQQVASSAPVWMPGGASASGLSRGRLFVTGRGGDRARGWWLTSLVDERVDQLLALTELLDRSTRSVAEMREGLGLADFEGRSFPGWHHHMTISSAAYAWRRLQGGTAPGPARV
ncbi:IS701 family transposase [Streptomyces paludis]|uniref:Transposase n=1 Tax=Streptomyces paludis TaxID=2282738 RepID=A0A345HZ29_9ACTN|nr:transposase [Streptomyces paludis]AXG81953.1 transposase [Streptomyces paludis]